MVSARRNPPTLRWIAECRIAREAEAASHDERDRTALAFSPATRQPNSPRGTYPRQSSRKTIRISRHGRGRRERVARGRGRPGAAGRRPAQARPSAPRSLSARAGFSSRSVCRRANHSRVPLSLRRCFPAASACPMRSARMAAAPHDLGHACLPRQQEASKPFASYSPVSTERSGFPRTPADFGGRSAAV